MPLCIAEQYLKMLLCIAEQYLSTCPGALCFCLSPVGNIMCIKCALGIAMVFVAA